MQPVRIQLKRTKGWKMPPNTVKVDRSTRFGNPFIVGQDGDVAECVTKHARWLTGALTDTAILSSVKQPMASWLTNMRHPRLGAILRELPGKNLACWCALDQPCHADVLLEIANAPEAASPVPRPKGHGADPEVEHHLPDGDA